MADLDKNATTVAGQPTGDLTESGNPTHNADGTFGSNGGEGTKDTSSPNKKMSFADFLSTYQSNEEDDLIDSFDLEETLEHIGFMPTADEIVKKIGDFFTPKVVSKLKEHNFEYEIGILKGNDGIYRKEENLLINVIGMARHPKHMTPIDEKEFKQYEDMILTQGSGKYNNGYNYGGGWFSSKNDPRLSRLSGMMPSIGKGSGYVKSFRGLTLPEQYYNRKNMNSLLDGYIGKSEVRGLYTDGCYGSTIYTTLSKGYGMNYADDLENPEVNHLMENIIDIRNANISDETSSYSLQNQLINRKEELKRNIKNKLQGQLDKTELEKLLRNFDATLSSDYGLSNILAGYDAIYVEGHQMDIYNQGIVMTKKNW